MTDIKASSIPNLRKSLFEPKISLLILLATFLVGAQQIESLFETPIAVIGRWIGVGLLVTVYWLLFIQKGMRLIIDKKWIAFLYVWLGWQLFLVIYHGQAPNEIFEERLARYLLMIAGVGFLAYKKSQQNALETLNRSYFWLNLILIFGSILFLSPQQLLSNERFTGLFRNPNYLSWAAANVFLVSFLMLFNQNRATTSTRSKVFWFFVLLASSILMLSAKTRGVFLAVPIAIIVFFWSQGFIKFARGLAIGLLLSVLLIWQFGNEVAVVTRVQIDPYSSTIDLDQITSGRATILERSVTELRSNSDRLIVGTDQRDLLRLGYLVREGGWHDPLALLHSDGLLGFVLYWSFVLALIIKSFHLVVTRSKHNISTSYTWAYPLTLVWLIKMVVGSIGDTILLIGHMDYIYFWLCAGCLIISVRDLSNEQA